jgi:hypothetical protein
MRAGVRLSTIRCMRERVLLGIGAVALIAGVPVTWSWLLYGSGLRSSQVLAAGIGLCLLTAAIGGAMLRLLDGGR